MDVNTLASVVTAGTATVAIVFALFALQIQTRQNNRALGVTILRDLEREFVSEDMKRERYELASFLLKRQPSEPLPPHLTDVLDFFDTVGTYLSKGVLDVEMTWDTYFYWLGHYYRLLREDIDLIERRNAGIVYYHNLRLMCAELDRFGYRHRKLPHGNEYYSPQRLKGFLEEELRACKVAMPDSFDAKALDLKIEGIEQGQQDDSHVKLAAPGCLPNKGLQADRRSSAVVNVSLPN